jgi:hypothetical protein
MKVHYLNEFIIYKHRSQDSAVDMATGYELDDWGTGVLVPVWSGFSHLHNIHTAPEVGGGG